MMVVTASSPPPGYSTAENSFLACCVKYTVATVATVCKEHMHTNRAECMKAAPWSETAFCEARCCNISRLINIDLGALHAW